MNTNIQNKINAIIFFITIFLYAALTNATETIFQSATISNNSPKSVKIIVDSNDHLHFSDVKRRCNYYWPYFKGKIKKPDGSVLKKSECIQYADLLNLSKGYAPHGVFFRSKVENSHSKILSYSWKIRGPLINKSARIVAEFDSFNAAMVFETAGKYDVNLQVKFQDGTQARDNIIVKVWARDGKTYFVDSKIGNDRFNGLSMMPDNKCIPEHEAVGECNGPWRSATRSFSVLAPRNSQHKVNLKPGDQILFNRDQTFKLETNITDLKNIKDDQRLECAPQISVNHWSNNLGIHFGAYGKGNIPLIKNSGDSSCFIFDFPGVGIMHISFQDLAFDLDNSGSSPHDNRASFLFAIGQPINLILNRISLKRFNQGLLFHNAHGIFINKSNFFDSSIGQLYSETATDVAFLNNKFDYSGNHISYTNMSHALVTGNTFSRIAFGRTALRVFGSDLKHFTESIWISDNQFEGWIDPRTTADCSPGRCQYADGKRYNWSLVELHPNVPNEDRFAEKIVFKRNILRNAETLLRVGAIHNLLVENNIFDTADNYGAARIKLHSDFARRPLKDIYIHNNLFLERSTKKSNENPTIELTEYSNDIENHKRLQITNNIFINASNDCIVKLKNLETKNKECLLNSSNNHRNKKRLSYLLFSQNKIKRIKSEKSIHKVIKKRKIKLN